jgi:hypothetical protein
LFCHSVDCNQNLCRECHPDTPALRKHKTSAPRDPSAQSEAPTLCDAHGQELSLFCKTDQRALCLLCVSSHTGHELCAIVEVADAMRDASLRAVASGLEAAERARAAKDGVHATMAAVEQVAAMRAGCA